MNRHNFNRKRNARRLAALIERQMQELSGSRQSWDEWRYLEQMQFNLFKQERG